MSRPVPRPQGVTAYPCKVLKGGFPDNYARTRARGAAVTGGDKVLVFRLFEKTSAAGRRYFAGRLGAARVVMLLDARSESVDPEWQVFVQDGGELKPPAPVQTASPGKTTSSRTSRKVPKESAALLLAYSRVGPDGRHRSAGKGRGNEETDPPQSRRTNGSRQE